MSAGEQMDISNKGKPYSPSTSVSGAQVPGEVETIRGKDNDIGKPRKVISIMSVGEQIFPSTSVPGAQVPGEVETIRGKDNDIGKPGKVISIMSVGEQIFPSTSVPGAQVPGEVETLRGKDNDIGKPGIVISIMSVGEQIFPSTSVPGAQVPGEAETVRGKDNDIVKPGKIISIESVGEQMEISNKGKPYSPSISVTGTQMPGEAETMRGKDNDIIDRNESGIDVITPIADAITKPISQVTHVNAIAQNDQKIPVSVPPVVVRPQAESRIFIGDQGIRQDTRRNELEILKSIVYGGLIESIASLGIVSSAAGSKTSTLNIVAMGLANLIAGLIVIVHDLFELRGDQHGIGDRKEEPSGRYWEKLGRKTNFRLHATVAVLSYIIFGLLPPVIYGFSFRKSNNKEYKLIAVAAASLLCIALLAIGKAHARQQKDYLKCLSYYIGLGVSASGLAYVAGVMINSLMVELGLFEPGADAPAPPSVGFIENGSKMPLWSSF